VEIGEDQCSPLLFCVSVPGGRIETSGRQATGQASWFARLIPRTIGGVRRAGPDSRDGADENLLWEAV
jgi:hypothetical protein